MTHSISRRKLLQFAGASAGVTLLPSVIQALPRAAENNNFIYCMNMATIRGHKLGLVGELETISKAGYTAAEIWMDSLEEYVTKGGTLADLNKRLHDLNISVVNSIGFAQWIVDDDGERKKAIEQLKREMDMLAQIGCNRTAAPPAGATDHPGLDLKKAAERYRAILELGDNTGVVPHLELWGFSANLSKLSEVMYVAIETGHPKAKILLDNFHIYKGGTSVDSLHLTNSSAVDILHMNDYGNIARNKITDGDRVLPGDGISPLKKILSILKDPARKLILSVEIFSEHYYKMDALQVANDAMSRLKKITQNV